MKRNLNIHALLFSLVALLVAAYVVVPLMFEALDAEKKEAVWFAERARVEFQSRLTHAIVCCRTNGHVRAEMARVRGNGGRAVRAQFAVVPGNPTCWEGPLEEHVRTALEPSIQDLARSVKLVLGRSVEKDVEAIPVGGKTYLVVWQKLAGYMARRPEQEGIRLVGFVVDYRAGMVFGSPRTLYWLSAALVAGLAFVSLAAVWMLVLSVRRTGREAALKTKFVANYAHELKTPLASLLLRAEMLRGGRYATEEKRARALDVIVTEGRRLNGMVLNLLDLIRIECRQMTYAREVFDLAELVRKGAETMRPFFQAQGLEIRAERPCRVRADAVRTQEILENLLSNAAKYAAARGCVEVEVEAVGRQVAFRVLDRGPGLPEQQMKFVFEEYWRAEDGLTREAGGSGIGLFISREYAQGMGGSLTVAPRVGGGCVFTCTVPGDPGEGEV